MKESELMNGVVGICCFFINDGPYLFVCIQIDIQRHFMNFTTIFGLPISVILAVHVPTQRETHFYVLFMYSP